MNLQSRQYEQTHRVPSIAPRAAQCGASGFVVLQVFVVTLAVVGLFDAACQPFGWQCLVQALICSLLAAALWFADSRLTHED